MYHMAHSMSELFGGYVTAKQHETIRGAEYNNSSSVRTVLDSSPSHPRVIKIPAAPPAAFTAEAIFSQLEWSPEISDSDDDFQTNPTSPSTQLPVDDGKLVFYEGRLRPSRSCFVSVLIHLKISPMIYQRMHPLIQ